MLRYRPSLESRPSTAPSQSIALVPHNPEALAVIVPFHDSEGPDDVIRDCDANAIMLQSRLQSLLNTARKTNESEETAVPLDKFLQQVNDERDKVEAALGTQIAAAAASFVNSLVQAPPDTRAEDFNASDDSDDTIEYSLSLEEAKIPVAETEETASRCQAPKAQLATQPWPLFYVEMTASPWSIWARKEPERKTVRKQENAKVIQRRSKAVEYLDNHPQQNSLHQSIKMTKLRKDIMKAVELVPSDDMVLDGANELRKELQLDCKASAKTAKERDRYWAKPLLHPLSVSPAPPAKTKLPPSKTRPHSTPRLQDVNPRDLQTRPSDYETIGLCTATVNVILPTSDNISQAVPAIQDIKMYKSEKATNSTRFFSNEAKVSPPALGRTLPTISTPTRSNFPLQFADLEKKLGFAESSPSVSDAGPEREPKLQVADAIETDKVVRRENVGKKPIFHENTIKTPAKETATQLMTCKKNRAANLGPDHFLSLLDLVRKK